MSNAFDSPVTFAHRVLIAAGLVALVALLVYFMGLLVDVLLLLFAAVLLTVAIDGLTRLVLRYLPLARLWALLVAFALILLFVLGLAALIGPQLVEQVPKLLQQLPAALQELFTTLRQLPGAEGLMAEMEEAEEDAELIDPELLAQLGGIFSTAVGAVAGLFVVLLLAFYLVLSPGQYVGQLLRLFPLARRRRLAEVLTLQGQALRLWLLSRLISMVFVGVSTAIGLLLLGVPLPFALGLISGLLTFIPYLGPILAAIPTAGVALMESPQLALYAVLLYFAVETLEANVVFPLAAKGVVHLPPAYTVFIQVAGGAVAGFPGLVLATPLTVAVAVAVQMLYIEDTLGDRIEVLGEGED